MAQAAGPLLIQPDPRTRRQMEYADLLMKQGADTSPAPNWLAAAARALTGVVGGYQRSLLEAKHEARQTAASEGLMRALEAGKGWKNPDPSGSEAGGQAAIDYAARAGTAHDGRTYLAGGERVGGGMEAMIAALEGQKNPDLASYAMQLRIGDFERQQTLADERAEEERREKREEARETRRHERNVARDELRYRRDLARDERKEGREAPTVQTFYDEQGREQKRVWNPQTRKWDELGGAKAAAPRLVKVLDENGDPLWVPVSEARGRPAPTSAGRDGAPTLAQVRENEAIEDARQRIAAMGLSPAALRSKLEYGIDPVLESLVKQASKRKYGEDHGFKAARNLVFGQRPATKTPPPSADLSKLSDDELLKKLGIQ